MIDLKKTERKIDRIIVSETHESLYEWILNKRLAEKGQNKAFRHHLKMLKVKQRVRKWGYYFQALRSHGCPCSCGMCSYEKYSRKVKHKHKEYV